MQRYFAKNKVENKIYLYDTDIHHIKNVMRMKPNDNIECVYNKKVYLCKVIDYNNNIEIIEEIKENNELECQIIVAIGLVKEQKLDLILQKLTELGVSKIIPLNTERSIVKLDNKKESKKIERWTSICKEASEQSHRNTIPEITNVMNIKDLDKIAADLKLVCSVKEKDNLISKYLQNKKKYATIMYVIGPEGGITDKEEETLNKYGFESVSLGSRVMRVETAAIYIASITNFYCMG